MNEDYFFIRIIRQPAFSVIFALLIFYIDYITGPAIQFPIFFILPVILLTWYNNLYWGLLMSVALPAGSLYYILCIWNKHPFMILAINMSIRIAILAFISFLISLVRKQQRQLSERINRLERILPICSYCKKIRDEKNNWHSVESYISGKTETQFSHGLCPECAEKYYGKYLKK